MQQKTVQLISLVVSLVLIDFDTVSIRILSSIATPIVPAVLRV